MKSFQLIFQVEDNTEPLPANKLKYDFYYMITYQSELNLDRSTGTITNGVYFLFASFSMSRKI